MMRLRRIAEGLRKSRFFCLMDWHDYVDESYDSRAFCVGGFLAPLRDWGKIETAWKRRIDYENRRSAKNGFPPISRYHATDCANFKNEFDKKNGWSIDRQVLLSKSLCKVIADYRPIGIVIGGTVEEFKQNFPGEVKNFRAVMYRFNFIMHLLSVADVMNRNFPDDRVTVYWDRSREFSPIARKEFDGLMEDSSMKHITKCFLTGAPLSWEDCIALQPADLMAYEGFKRLSMVRSGKDELRKAMLAMLGDKTPIMVGAYTDGMYKHLSSMIGEREQEEALLWHKATCDD